MGEKASRNKKSKKTLGSMIISAIATIIVIVATLLGFGGDDGESANANTVPDNIGPSEVVSEIYEETLDDELQEEDVSQEVSEASSEEYVEEEPVSEEVTVAEITFRSEYLLDQHYDKHGIEMGFASAEEYELAAYKVIIHPDALHKIESEDGDDVYYVEATNEFVVVSRDGYIRTYFNPNAGIDYYNRQ